MRNDLVQNIAKVLTRIKAQPNQGYKRLMDEVGLSSRSSHTPVHNAQNHAHPNGFERSRPGSQQNNGYPTPQNLQRPFSSGFMPAVQGQVYDNSQSPVRTGSADSLSFPSYGYGQAQPQYNQMPQQVSPHQLQYQNYMGGPQRSNYNQMAATAFPGYATPPPSAETLRGVNPGSPFAGYGQMSPVMGNAGFGGQQYMQQPQYGFQQQNFFPQQMQAVNGGGRRGRRAPYQAY